MRVYSLGHNLGSKVSGHPFWNWRPTHQTGCRHSGGPQFRRLHSDGLPLRGSRLSVDFGRGNPFIKLVGHCGGSESQAADFGPDSASDWGSTLWGSRISDHRLWTWRPPGWTRGLHSKGRHFRGPHYEATDNGALKSRATDLDLANRSLGLGELRIALYTTSKALQSAICESNLLLYG